MKAPISDIYIDPDRARHDLGDLRELQRSIQDIGLLHPVVVTPDNETIYAWRLIAGQRRIAACTALGLVEVPITVVNDLSELGELLAERDENTCRKELTPSEMVAIAAEVERLERPQSEARRAGTLVQNAQVTPVVGTGTQRNGRTRDIVAEAVGTSHRTLQRAKAVVEAAEDDSDPVRAARAEEAVVEMDATGNVKGAWAKVFTPEGPLKCSVCHQEKDPDEFAGGGPDHRGGKTYECRSCARERHAVTTTPRRRAAFADQNGSTPKRSRSRPKSIDPRVTRKRERMADVERLWHQGFRYREIAEQLNSTERTIQDDVRNLGLAGQRRNGSHSQSVIETIDRVTTTLADVVGVIIDHKRRLRLDVDGIEISDEMAKEWESRLSMVGSASRLIRDITKQKRTATDE